jgi:transposase InsO family protein
MRKSIKEIIDAFKERQNYSLVGRKLGIDRRTVKFWVVKGRSVHNWGYISSRGLKRNSTKPKTVHKLLSVQDEDRIIQIKQDLGYGKEKLAVQAKKIGIIASPSTAYRTVKNRRPELLGEVKNYRRPKFQNGYAMRPRNTSKPGFMQADVKYVTPELSGLPFTCFEYGFVDIFSRFKMALILPILDESGMILTLKYVIEQAPFKINYVQTDNGLENQSLFHKACLENKITHYYIHKHSPNENAVVERSFKTDQDEFFFRLDKAPLDINELNLWFQTYLRRYNYERPHFGLNLMTPIEFLEQYNMTLNVQ